MKPRTLAIAAGALVFCGAISLLVAWRSGSTRDAAVADVRQQVAVIDSEVQGIDFDWDSRACEPKDSALCGKIGRKSLVSRSGGDGLVRPLRPLLHAALPLVRFL